MNKSVYLGLSTLELSKKLMYEFWQDYVKPKSDKKTKLCDMDTQKQTIFTNILQKMLKKHLTLQIMNQNAIILTDHSLKKKNEKVITLMKDEPDGEILKKFVGLILKT